jgi:hypothetical protein
MAWTIDDVEHGDGWRSVGGDHPLNDAEAILAILFALAGLGYFGWQAVTDPDPSRAAPAAGLAVMALVVLVFVVRYARTGLFVGRHGVLVRRFASRRVELRWSEISGFALDDRPPWAGREWRVLRIDASGGRALWIWRVRTHRNGTMSLGEPRRADDPGPDPADELAARLEELRVRASGGI